MNTPVPAITVTNRNAALAKAIQLLIDTPRDAKHYDGVVLDIEPLQSGAVIVHVTKLNVALDDSVQKRFEDPADDFVGRKVIFTLYNSDVDLSLAGLHSEVSEYFQVGSFVGVGPRSDT